METTKKYIPYLQSFDRYGFQRFYVWDTELNAWTLDYKTAGIYTMSELIKLKRKYGVSGKTVCNIDKSINDYYKATKIKWHELDELKQAVYIANETADQLIYQIEYNCIIMSKFEDYIYLYEKTIKTINEILL